jgi:P pilus assembly protein, chaperone PapD
MRHTMTRLATIAAATALFAAGQALAGSFQVNPVRLDLSSKATTAALTLKNTGTESVVVQVSVEGWAQQDGKDAYSPTREVLVTPTVLTVPPSAERIIRVGLRRAADPKNELSYRLFLQEVPPPPQPGFQGLVVALRVGLPVFVQPTQADAAPRMPRSATRLADNKVEITAANEGNAHLQLSEFSLFAGSGDAVGTQTGLTYVLPEQRRSWVVPLSAPLSATRLQLKAVTDAGNIETEMPVTQ